MKSGRTFLTKTLFVLVLLSGLAVSQHVYAATYYVDSSITDTSVGSATPDCTNYDPVAFTCSGGSASAYKTIADINAFSALAPGDSVLFRKGQTWREQLTVPSSGTAGNPITFGSYGSGNKPQILADDVVSGWTTEPQTGSNYTSTSTLISYWNFEDASSPSADGKIDNANNLSWGGSYSRSSQHVQGSYSLTAAGNGGAASRSFASLSSNFPGKAATTAFTIGFWMLATSTNFSSFSNIVVFTDNSHGFTFNSNSLNGIRVRRLHFSTEGVIRHDPG
jgi:hypothetical protein